MRTISLSCVLFVSACGGETVVVREYGPCEDTEDCRGRGECQDGVCVVVVKVPVPADEGEAESEAESESESEECAPTGEEICDYADNDCDGEVDEDYRETGTGCYRGDGDCRRYGLMACQPDGSNQCVDETGAVIPEPIEICDDELDNDCDGYVDCGTFGCGPCEPEGWESESESEGEEACTTITTPGGDEVEVSGAPRFFLHATSPSGAAVPGVGEVLRFVVEGVGCSDVLVDHLQLRVLFTDNAVSGWTPGLMRVYFTQPDGILREQAAAGVSDEGDGLIYDFSFGGSPAAMHIVAGTMNVVRIELDTTGASPALDDTVRVGLEGPLEFWTLDDGVAYEMDVEILGGTLVY